MKKTILFFSAAFSLLITGVLLNDNLNGYKVLLLTIGVLCGIILIYDVKSSNDKGSLFKKVICFLSCKKQAFFSILLIALIPLAYTYLTLISFLAFAVSGILGVGYSVRFTLNNKSFKLKEIFILKNLLIGVGWGLLVIAGYGSLDNDIVIYITIFASIQVFIGSTIRDLPHETIDKNKGVNSLPVRVGGQKTLMVLHIFNLLSLLLLLLAIQNFNYMILIGGIVGWRFVNLFNLSHNYQSKLWGQTFNLLTCVMFLFITFIQYLWN
jgi:4-hydroxybenzoate polyprenyltransferase